MSSGNAAVSATRASLSDDVLSVKLELARELHTEALYHKREAARHKRAMAHAFERFDRFRRDLEAMGITVIVEEQQPQSPRRQSDGSRGGNATHHS